MKSEILLVDGLRWLGKWSGILTSLVFTDITPYYFELNTVDCNCCLQNTIQKTSFYTCLSGYKVLIVLRSLNSYNDAMLSLFN